MPMHLGLKVVDNSWYPQHSLSTPYEKKGIAKDPPDVPKAFKHVFDRRLAGWIQRRVKKTTNKNLDLIVDSDFLLSFGATSS